MLLFFKKKKSRANGVVALRSATAAKLKHISRTRTLSLTLDEMRTIQKYYKRLKRDPTELEIETIAQTWSEHCKHKVFNGLIDYNDVTGSRIIDNLFKHTIVKATRDIRNDLNDNDFCVSVFSDNAGIIKFIPGWHMVFKVETHNHPSALDPYGGASTGIGGVIRDVLGCGLSARPILNTDVFCFAPPNVPFSRLPQGVLHPKRIFKGVVAGVRDYGNRMGIPTINGSVQFDARYLGNPIVYCGTAGIIPDNKIKKEINNNDYIVSIGGRTGRDGIHGATFSSAELGTESETESASAVQIGNPIEEKKVLDVLMIARDEGLYRAITDCGAGGYSSAVGEMAEHCGAHIELSNVPLKYKGLQPWEIFLSEAQERMVLAIPPDKWERFHALCTEWDVEATRLGTFNTSGKLVVTYNDTVVGELDLDFLHNGYPRLKRRAEYFPRKITEITLLEPDHYTDTLKTLLSDYCAASKEWIIRQYDHEVQGGTILKPLTGIAHDGPSDAAVMVPIPERPDTGIAVAHGMATRLGDIDPYTMAQAAIDEALRSLVAVGVDPSHVAILDNFCMGNPERPEILGALVRAAEGCRDTALIYRTPFVSGKDSFYNEYNDNGSLISIPHTLLISAFAPINTKHIVSMDIKEPGNPIFLLGALTKMLGGSLYLQHRGVESAKIPLLNASAAIEAYTKLHQAIILGYVRACHDISDGGLAVAAAEMAFAGGHGIAIDLNKAPNADAKRDDEALFNEHPGQLLIEVARDKEEEFVSIMNTSACGRIGTVQDATRLIITGLTGRTLIDEDIQLLKKAWQAPLQW